MKDKQTRGYSLMVQRLTGNLQKINFCKLTIILIGDNLRKLFLDVKSFYKKYATSAAPLSMPQPHYPRSPDAALAHFPSNPNHSESNDRRAPPFKITPAPYFLPNAPGIFPFIFGTRQLAGGIPPLFVDSFSICLLTE
jgi:hypothetical protein